MTMMDYRVAFVTIVYLAAGAAIAFVAEAEIRSISREEWRRTTGRAWPVTLTDRVSLFALLVIAWPVALAWPWIKSLAGRG